jgi:uncharacterized protein
MIGAPGELAAVTTTAAQQHLATLTGDSADTLWRNQIAPRGLLQMTTYRPAAAAAPSSTVREYPGTHFDFYRDPALRDRVLADQVRFLREHLAA